MSIKKIVKYGEAVLRRPSKEVSKISKKIQTLVHDLLDTMYAKNGVGLADFVDAAVGFEGVCYRCVNRQPAFAPYCIHQPKNHQKKRRMQQL